MIPKPTLESKHSRAWRYDLADFMRRHNVKRTPTLDSWIVFAPWANLMWHSYAIHLMHLRPVSGFPPVTFYLPGATHEIMVAALDPDWALDLTQAPSQLQPFNFVGQWIERGEDNEAKDTAARERCTKSIMEILDGALSPDTDYTQHWIARYGHYGIKDPATAGQTQIVMQGRNITIDPRATTYLPKHNLCPECGAPCINAGPFGIHCAVCQRKENPPRAK